MSTKADDRLAKLASFGASAASKQTKQPPINATVEGQSSSGLPDEAPMVAAMQSEVPSLPKVLVRQGKMVSPPMIRNIAFTSQEQEILKTLMDYLRNTGEMSPNLSLAVRVGLRLIPKNPSMTAVRDAVESCKALDGRRKDARSKQHPK